MNQQLFIETNLQQIWMRLMKYCFLDPMDNGWRCYMKLALCVYVLALQITYQYRLTSETKKQINLIQVDFRQTLLFSYDRCICSRFTSIYITAFPWVCKMEIIKISWEVKWILCLHDQDSKEKRNIAWILNTILNRLKICNILYFNWFGPSVIGLLWYTQVLGCLFFRLSGMPLFCQKIGKVSNSSDRFTTPTHLFLFVTRSLYRVSLNIFVIPDRNLIRCRFKLNLLKPIILSNKSYQTKSQRNLALSLVSIITGYKY